jgi:hypothetical protein
MTVSNDFLPFAQGGGANVETQISYAADPLLPVGNQPGIAVSAFNNKAIRQANAVTSQLAQYVANTTGVPTTDDATPLKLLAQIQASMAFLPPVVTVWKSNGTHNITTAFFLASGNATVGATYTNNAITFTVSATIAAGQILYATGAGASAASGTLTKASGTGDATITFYAARTCLKLRARGVGGGGGGEGSGGSQGGGGNGVASTFGSQLSAGGGIGSTGGGGAGGTSSLGTGPVGITPVGSGGGGASNMNNTTALAAGGPGGSSYLGGGAPGVLANGSNGTAGIAAPVNSGGGGGGASSGNSGVTLNGGGGGGGGGIDAIIPFGNAAYMYTYAVVVGTGGAGGTAGTSPTGSAGAAGGTGIWEITEDFQ